MSIIYKNFTFLLLILSGNALFATQSFFQTAEPWKRGFKDVIIQCAADNTPVKTTPLEKHIENSPITLGSGKNRYNHPAAIQTKENNACIAETINEVYQLAELSPQYAQEAIKICLEKLATISYPYTGPLTQQQTDLFLQKLLPTVPSTLLTNCTKTALLVYKVTQLLDENLPFYIVHNTKAVYFLAIMILALDYLYKNPRNPMPRQLLKILNEFNEKTMLTLFFALIAEGTAYLTITLFSNFFERIIKNLPTIEELYQKAQLLNSISRLREKNLTTKKDSIFKSQHNNNPSLNSLKNILLFFKNVLQGLEKNCLYSLKNKHLIDQKATTLHQAYPRLLQNIENLKKRFTATNGFSGLSWQINATPESIDAFKRRFTLPVLESELTNEKKLCDANMYEQMLHIQPYIQKLMDFTAGISHILQQIELHQKPTTILEKWKAQLHRWWTP